MAAFNKVINLNLNARNRLRALALVTVLVAGVPATAALTQSPISIPMPPTRPTFQQQIDDAFAEILHTEVGQAICTQILGSRPDALEFHLGISHEAAMRIAPQCAVRMPNAARSHEALNRASWIFPTAPEDINKINAKSFQPRKYIFVTAQNGLAVDSWTDKPITNTTALLGGPEGLSHARLVKLLTHETCVYFDPKTDPTHPDAQAIPQLRDLKVESTSAMKPMIAISNPLTAHTLTFLRCLQVEFAVVDELVRTHVMESPSDRLDPYLNYLISPTCTDTCVHELVNKLRSSYLPIALPLLALAPRFRAMVNPELARISPNWTSDQWQRFQQSINFDPENYVSDQFSGDPIMDLQKIFSLSSSASNSFKTATEFVRDDLWPLEQPALNAIAVRSGDGQKTTLLEFMKRPLMSIYNIRLSSGPRVRIGTGNVE